MSNFIDLCMQGDCLLEDIDDYVENWHAGASPLPLHEYLGMSRSEYSLWVVDPDIVHFIVDARRRGADVVDLIEEFHAMPMAARADSPGKAKKLAHWLKTNGLWQ